MIATHYTNEFTEIIAGCGIEAVKLPARSRNLNAYAGRFVRTIKEDGLDRMVFLGEDMLRRTIRESVTHHHEERNHQGLDNQLLIKKATIVDCPGPVRKRERVGGLLNYYFREAAYFVIPDTTGSVSKRDRCFSRVLIGREDRGGHRK